MAVQGDARALVGRTLGEFVIREPLSGGGFGMVFLAEQKGLTREAVIKVLHEHHQANDTSVQRFLREARLATLLDHPYAAHTYAFGAEPDGLLWIAMERVRGTPLDTLLRVQGPIPLERFLPLLERICEVVETAHEQGIVHRDLKPANVMVLSRAGQLLPKLLDFGIAKLTGTAEPTGEREGSPVTGPIEPLNLTGGGTAIGSPLYMAPEQWVDASAADARTDIYALGVVAFQALTGKPPFVGPSRREVGNMHARDPVPPLGTAFPAPLQDVLIRAMAKRPNQRYQSALELAAGFRAACGPSELVGVPHLDERQQEVLVSRAPQPLARAVMLLDVARNPHQARDALWQLVRVAVRLVSGIALASHAHVVTDGARSDSPLADALRRLRERAPSDQVWLDVARQLVRAFAAPRDAHPVPELVGFLTSEASEPLDDLLALRSDEAGGGGDEQVRELLEIGLPLAARALEALDFLYDYPLVVPVDGDDGDEVEMWMGARGDARPRRPASTAGLAMGRPALVDRAWIPVVSLWPFVQLHEPSPGAPPALFLFDGRGRRGARMMALPDAFELESEEPWLSLGEMLRDQSNANRATTSEEVRPFPGLAAFSGESADYFTGREREAEAFVNRLRVQPLLVIAGPSGAGKSSFVHAGVVPGLPPGWQTIAVRPGPEPLVSLAARLAAGGIEVGDLGAALEEDPDALGAALRARGQPILLFVDQLEELFTLCDDQDTRELYAAALSRAARLPEDSVRVVMTLRDDFLVRTESLPAWRSRLSQGLQLLTTPAEPELRRILTEPLRRAGYEFDDPALPDEMVAAVAGTPGALALLSFTASRLWELRDRRFRQIGRKAYRSLGGVGGALAQHAETTLTAMPSEEQRLVREVFRHAVTAEGTRAVLSPDELVEVLGGGPHAASVIEKLVAARLLVVSDAEVSGELIEIAHETLLEAWPRLVDWRREDSEGARLRDLLRAAARQWEERGRSSGLLWRGDALAEYRQWRQRYPGALTASEESFAAASLADAARGRRLRRLLVGGAFLALAAVAVSLLILNARAERQRRLALASRQELRDLLRSQYESQGRRLVVADDPLQGLAYLAKAAELGAGGMAHDFLVAQAIRATDGELYLVEHASAIARARFSPDGTRIATAGADNQARLWDAARGALIARIDHRAAVIRVAFSPDGSLLASGAIDGTVILSSAADGRTLHTLTTIGAVQGLEFSPDGSRLATHTGQDDLRLWNPVDGAPIATLGVPDKVPSYAVGSPCAFSLDGRMVAAGGRDGLVRVWDTGRGTEVASLTGHRERVTWVRFSPDGQRLVSASLDDTALVWRLADRKRELALRHRDDVGSAVFSPDGTRVLTASADRTAVLWDAASGQALHTLAGHAAGVNLAVYSSDGLQIATASDDATAQLWDGKSGGRLARRVGHRSVIRDVGFDGAGRHMVTASLDGAAIVWSTEPTQRVTPLVGHTGPVYSADLAPDGSPVATGGEDGTARLWDPVTGRQLLAVRPGQPVLAVRYSPDGRAIATAGFEPVVRLWDAATGKPMAALEGHSDIVQAIAWHPDATLLASASDDGTARIWSAESGALVRSIRGHGGARIFGIAFAPDGAALATTGDDNAIALWDPHTGRQLARFAGKEPRYPLAFDPTGARLVSGTGRSATVWLVKDGSLATELLGHVSNVQGAAWSPDGRLIATASADRSARIWDSDTGNLLAVLEHSAPVLAVSFAPNGVALVTASDDGTARMWELPHATGSAADLARLLRCRVPYRVEGERVVPRLRELTACRAIAQ